MKKYVISIFIYLVAILVIHQFILTGTGNGKEFSPEYVVYTYELKGEELVALQQRYLAADKATRVELFWETGRLLGFSDSSIGRDFSYEELEMWNMTGFILRESASVTLSKQYFVSDINGNVHGVSEEEAYRIAAESDFQKRIQKLLGE